MAAGSSPSTGASRTVEPSFAGIRAVPMTVSPGGSLRATMATRRTLSRTGCPFHLGQPKKSARARARLRPRSAVKRRRTGCEASKTKPYAHAPAASAVGPVPWSPVRRTKARRINAERHGPAAIGSDTAPGQDRRQLHPPRRRRDDRVGGIWLSSLRGRQRQRRGVPGSALKMPRLAFDPNGNARLPIRARGEAARPVSFV